MSEINRVLRPNGRLVIVFRDHSVNPPAWLPNSISRSGNEIELAIDDTPAKSYGSQGQQRTLVLALKLAELELIEQIVGEPPLLLLDDVLAELDLTRQNQLLSVIEDRFQTLITTTHLGAFDAKWLDSSQILQVRSGKIVPA